MNIREEYQKLATTKIDSNNFEYFMRIAQELSKNYSESRKQNVKRVPVKVQNGTHVKEVFSEQYKLEQEFLILFFHKYANMINGINTEFDIGTHVQTRDFLVGAHYDGEKVSYQTNVIMREKCHNFANVIELCAHENRHAMQFKAFSIDRPEEIIHFDPNSIVLIKDCLVMLNGNYGKNHINSLMEIDANLYATGISRELVSHYFSEHQQDLKYTDMARKQEITDNPFYDLFTPGESITGEYKLENGEKIDRIIMMDQNLKKMISPQLVERYPILNLIWKDGNFKTYSEIMEDKQALLKRISSESIRTIESPSYDSRSISAKGRVAQWYDAIIKSDPMLYLESMLSNEHEGAKTMEIRVGNFFLEHPTLLNEYRAIIEEIFARKSAEIEGPQRSCIEKLASKLKIDISNPERISMAEVSKQALIKGVRTGTVKEADEQILTAQTKGKDKESNKSLVDLDEFIEFIDPKRINDSRFLAILRDYRYRTEIMSPEEYVDWVEEAYKKTFEKIEEESVDTTEYTIR